MKQIIIYSILILLAVIGFVDAIYLTLAGTEFQLFENICSDDCGNKSLKILGIHISIYGIFYYLSLVILSISLLKAAKYIAYPMFISFVGLLFSLYFLYHQIFIIGGYCIFCLISLTTTFTYFVIILWQFLRFRKANKA